SENIHHGGFSGTAGSHQRDELTGEYLERDASDRVYIDFTSVVSLFDVFEPDDGVHDGVEGLRRTDHQVIRAAVPHTIAPIAIVHCTPNQYERLPASSPPRAIMPPNTKAQMPITRPPTPSATLASISALVSDTYNSI